MKMKLLILVLACLALVATPVLAWAGPDTCCCNNGDCLTRRCDKGDPNHGNDFCNTQVCIEEGQNGGACNDLCCDSKTPEFTTLGVGIAVVAAGGVGYWLMRKNKK